MRCISITNKGFMCKRQSVNGDYCTQHNPVTHDNVTCGICLDDIKDPFKLKCSHIFCKDCMDQAIIVDKPNCPNCRQELSGHEIIKTVRRKFGSIQAKGFEFCLDLQTYPDVYKKPYICWTRKRKSLFKFNFKHMEHRHLTQRLINLGTVLWN